MDAGPQTTLTAAVLSELRISGVEALIKRVYTDNLTPAEIAGLTRLVNERGDQGDEVAMRLLKEAARELVHSADTVRSKLHLSSPVPCALAGGVLTESTIVLQEFTRQVRTGALGLEPISTVREPVLGAVKLARMMVHPR